MGGDRNGREPVVEDFLGRDFKATNGGSAVLMGVS